jgi:glutamate racemase
VLSRENPIGIFDSGVGGLTVLREIIRELPAESTIYLGDTARVPYGIRSPETVTKYSIENADFLTSKAIKLLVIACNTSSSVSLPVLSKSFSVPVIGVIEPGARAAVDRSKTKKISVIGTETTIRSDSYKKAIKSIDNSADVISIACPLFVPLVEEGWLNGKIVALTAEKYLSPIKDYGVDVLVLGCTHYPMIKDVIYKAVNPIRKPAPSLSDKSITGSGHEFSNGVKIALIDSAVETAREVRHILESTNMLNNNNRTPSREFFVTDSVEKFSQTGEGFLGHAISDISKINIGT